MRRRASPKVSGVRQVPLSQTSAETGKRLPRDANMDANGDANRSPRRSTSRSRSRPKGSSVGKLEEGGPEGFTASETKRHFHHHEMPPHLAFNRYILTGYRRPGLTPLEALSSALSHFHNETFNILSHFAVFISSIVLMVQTASIHPLTEKHFASVFFSLVCGAVCFFGSSVYHTLMPSTLDALSYRKLLLADLLGILAVNLGLTTCVVYLMAPCASTVIKLSVTLIPSLVTFLALIFAKTPGQRMAGYGFQLLSRWGFVLVVHHLNFSHWTASEALRHGLLELLTALGAAINVARFPERWLRPGSVDLLPFNSHTLMHLLTGASFLLRYREALQQAIFVHEDSALLLCSRHA